MDDLMDYLLVESVPHGYGDASLGLGGKGLRTGRAGPTAKAQRIADDTVASLSAIDWPPDRIVPDECGGVILYFDGSNGRRAGIHVYDCGYVCAFATLQPTLIWRADPRKVKRLVEDARFQAGAL